MLKFLTNTCLWSEFTAQHSSKLRDVTLCKKRCTTKTKPKTLVRILKKFQFILLCVGKLILFQNEVISSKRLFLSMTMCISLMRRRSWPLWILIVLLPSTLKLGQTSDISTDNIKTIPEPVKNPGAFQLRINVTVLLMNSLPLTSFWTRTIYGTWIRQLLCHLTTPLAGTLCSFSTHKQQLTNLEQT